MTGATLTIDQIRAVARCNAEPTLFLETFGESVEVTPEAIVPHRSSFDWKDAQRLLDAEALAEYEPALSEARKAYHRTLAKAVREKVDDIESVRTECRETWDATLAPLWARLYVETRRRVGDAA